MNILHAIIIGAVAATVGVLTNNIEEAWQRALIPAAAVILTYYILKSFEKREN